MDKKTIMRLAIANGLEKVLEKSESLQEVSVQQIIDECGLSRPTFYRYFSDKYDVVNWSYTYQVEELSGLYAKSAVRDDDDLLLHFVRFFYSKRNFFTKAMEYLGQNSFYEHYFAGLVRWYTMLRYNELKDVSALKPQEHYMLIYAAAGVSQVLHKWLAEGCPETPEEMAAILRRFSPGDTHHYDI